MECEKAYEAYDIKNIQNAIMFGKNIKRECISRGISAFTYLQQIIPVHNFPELEEGLYRINGKLVAVAHDCTNEMSVLQILAMLLVPHCRYANGENTDLLLVGFIEGFKGTTSFSSYCCPEYKEILSQNLFHRGS